MHSRYAYYLLYQSISTSKSSISTEVCIQYELVCHSIHTIDSMHTTTPRVLYGKCRYGGF